MNEKILSNRRTFQEQVLERLGQDICSGVYAPGTPIPSETELCARFSFSRIVIREAVKSLAAKGVLEVRRRVGTLVRDPAQWNLFDPDVIRWRAQCGDLNGGLARDLMELRRIIEPAASRLAAQRGSPEEKAKLRAAFMAMQRACAGEGDYVTADLAFHETVLAASGNQFVRQMQCALSAVLRTSFTLISRQPGGPAYSLPMHEAVCCAIEAGDAQAAELAANKLIDQAVKDLSAQLNSGESGTESKNKEEHQDESFPF